MYHESFQVHGSREAGAEPIEECGPSSGRERRAIAALHLNDLKEYRESFRAKNGDTVNVRFVEQGDREELKSYIRSMSARCRYNRFLSVSSELPPSQF